MKIETAPAGNPDRLSHLTRLDRCHDRDSPYGILVVLDVLDEPANEYELTGGITVADVHDGYPRDDPVVICIYDRILDGYRDAWDIDSPHLVDWLRDVDAELRYYPESKLERYDAGNYTETADGCRCEHCQTEVPTTTDWVEHLVRDCTAI